VRGDAGLGQRLVLQRDIGCFLMHRDQIGLFLEHGLGDVIGELVRHGGVHHQHIPDAGRLIVHALARIDRLADRGRRIELAIFGVHLLDQIVMIDQLHLGVRRRPQIGNRRRRQAAHPEEGVDLAVLGRAHRFRNAQPRALHVLVRIEPGRLDYPERHHLRRACP
jgi:hypothetical protein